MEDDFISTTEEDTPQPQFSQVRYTSFCFRHPQHRASIAKGQTVNPEFNCNDLKRLREEVIRQKRSGSVERKKLYSSRPAITLRAQLFSLLGFSWKTTWYCFSNRPIRQIQHQWTSVSSLKRNCRSNVRSLLKSRKIRRKSSLMENNFQAGFSKRQTRCDNALLCNMTIQKSWVNKLIIHISLVSSFSLTITRLSQNDIVRYDRSIKERTKSD